MIANGKLQMHTTLFVQIIKKNLYVIFSYILDNVLSQHSSPLGEATRWLLTNPFLGKLEPSALMWKQM